MALSDEIMRANPVGYWPLSTNTTNVAGMLAATVTAAPAYSQRNISTTGSSSLFDTTDRLTITDPAIMYAGREHFSFAVETFVRTVGTPTSTRRIFGKALPDGLYLTTTGFEFTLQTSTGTYTARYDVPTWDATYHVAAVYSGQAILLIVNGVQVATVEISGTFSSTVEDIIIGGSVTTSAASFYLSDFALYHRAISIEEAYNHYAAGIFLPLQTDLIEQDGGISYDFTDATTDIFVSVQDSTENYYGGASTNLTNDGYSFRLTDNTLPGIRTTFPVPLADGAVIDGSRVSWVGTGITVDRSLDGGQTWAACTNNAIIPGLGEGVNVDTLLLSFRINIPASTAKVFYQSLNAVVYINKSPKGSLNSMAATGVEPYTLSAIESTPLANVSASGVQIRTPGRVIIPAPPTGTTWKALEFWVRPAGALIDGHIFDYRASFSDTVGYAWFTTGGVYAQTGMSKTYVNGVLKTPVTSDFTLGQWTHVMYILTTPTSNPIYVGGNVGGAANLNVDIGSVGLYLSEPPASTPAEHYTLGFQRGSVRVNDQLTMIEGIASAQGVTPQRFGPRVYKYAWNVESSQ